MYIVSSLETQGQSVWSGEKAGRKFSSTGKRAPGYRLSPNYFQKFKQIPAPDWAQKNALYYCAQPANSFSWVLFMSSYTTAIVSITVCLAHAPEKCTQLWNFQFDIKSPSDSKILSARKPKTRFQKYMLELTTGIDACISVTSCVNVKESLRDTTTADDHENVAWKSEFTFFQSLSWLFQLAYFVKSKRTLLELNFYQPWREWILSLRTRGIFTDSRAFDAKKLQKSLMHVQSFCFALSSYCLFDFLVAAAS